MPFNELLEEVDRLAGLNMFNENIVCQSGQSTYQMQNGLQFVSRPSIDNLVSESSMVVTHGGATVIQLLIAKKPFIAFPNPRGAGNHQTSFLKQVASVCDISWSQTVNEMSSLFASRKMRGPVLIRTDYPRVVDIIRNR